MRFAIQICALTLGLPLQVLIIAALLRGGYRRWPFIFAYMVLDLLTTILEVPAALEYFRGVHHPASSGSSLPGLYWPIEALMQLMIYAVVMSLIYKATAPLRPRKTVRAALITGAILFAGVSFLIHYNPTSGTGMWMTPWTRDLNFCSAILDLALWTLLISQREKDNRLLMLSGGLGIEFTGDAIGLSIRQLALHTRSRPIALAGGVLGMLANLTFLYIWWQALRGPDGDAGSSRNAKREPSTQKLA